MYRSPNHGFRDIAAELRQELLDRWQPGRRLPTFAELTERFGTTPVTLQRAMSLLAEQGFVVSRPRVGSFVASLPPQSCQVGLVFPGHPGDINPSWSRQHLSNLVVAEELNQSQERWRFRFYMDVGHRVGSKGLPRLMQDVEDRALAGLIWSYGPFDLQETPLIRKPPVPTVHFNAKLAESTPSLKISFSGKSFIPTALEWAKRRGLERVAVLSSAKFLPAELQRSFAEFSLTFRPEWVLPVDVFRMDWMPHILAALFRDHPDGLPEMLIITDDHLVEPAIELLLGLGVPGLAELDLFASWNFPLPYNGKLPITRYGYDARAWIRAALELVAASADPPTTGTSPARVAPMHLAEWQASAERQGPAYLHLIRQAKDLLAASAL